METDSRFVLARGPVDLPNGTEAWAEWREGQTAREAADAFLDAHDVAGLDQGVAHRARLQTEVARFLVLMASDAGAGANKDADADEDAVSDEDEDDDSEGAPSVSAAAVGEVHCVSPSAPPHQLWDEPSPRPLCRGRRGGVQRLELEPGAWVKLVEEARNATGAPRTWERRCPACATRCVFAPRLEGAAWAVREGGEGARYRAGAGEQCLGDRGSDGGPARADDDDVVASIPIDLSAMMGGKSDAAAPVDLILRRGETISGAVDRFLTDLTAGAEELNRGRFDDRGAFLALRRQLETAVRSADGELSGLFAVAELSIQGVDGGGPADGAPTAPLKEDDRAAYYSASGPAEGPPYPSMAWYSGIPNGAEFFWGPFIDSDAAMYTWTTGGPGQMAATLGEPSFFAFVDPVLRDIADLVDAAGVGVDVPVVVGDNATEPRAPAICKTRPVGSRNCALIKRIQARRHWEPVETVSDLDTPFEAKTPAAVWRGQSTGRWMPDGVGGCSRQLLYLRWGTGDPSDAVDVGLVPGGVGTADTSIPNLVLKRELSVTAMLRNRYLVSVEGHDVASNLKWVLASWSVPLMPRPRTESWLMEGLLDPYVHYVPLADDTSDLEAQVAWCEARVGRCREVAEAGRRWMEMFGDAEAERALEERVVREFVARHARALSGRAAYLAAHVQALDAWRAGEGALTAAEAAAGALARVEAEGHGDLVELLSPDLEAWLIEQAFLVWRAGILSTSFARPFSATDRWMAQGQIVVPVDLPEDRGVVEVVWRVGQSSMEAATAALAKLILSNDVRCKGLDLRSLMENRDDLALWLREAADGWPTGQRSRGVRVPALDVFRVLAPPASVARVVLPDGVRTSIAVWERPDTAWEAAARFLSALPPDLGALMSHRHEEVADALEARDAARPTREGSGRRPVVFLHVTKAAGTSFVAAMTELGGRTAWPQRENGDAPQEGPSGTGFGRRDTLPIFEYSPAQWRAFWRRADRRGVDFVRWERYFFPDFSAVRAAVDLDWVTILRDPYARFISDYLFFRDIFRIDAARHAADARSYMDSKSPSARPNFVVRMLNGLVSPWGGPFVEVGPTHLEHAKAVLRSFTTVAILEDRASMARLEARYGVVLGHENENKNHRSGDGTEDDRVMPREDFERLNALDVELYRWARDKLQG